MDLERLGASSVTLFGIVAFFHGIEGLLDLVAPESAASQALFGTALFVGSAGGLVLSRGYVDATGYDDGDGGDAGDETSILPRPRRSASAFAAWLRRPVRCNHARCHVDVWLIATGNGIGLCTAWAGIDYVLDAAPRLLLWRSDYTYLVGTCVLGNAILVANRQLFSQFHSRLDLSGSHVLEPAPRAS